MNKESYVYMKEKTYKFESLESAIMKHQKTLEFCGRRPNSPVQINIDSGTYYIMLSDELKQKAIDLIKEQLEMYEQEMKEL